MTVVLAIETSCDETGVGIARLDADGTVTLLADEVASSVDEHVRFGGVVPEIASRAHLEALGPAMRRALAGRGHRKNRTSSRPPSGRGWRVRCWWEWLRPKPIRLPGRCRSTR